MALTSLFTGVAGVNANMSALSVVGNNIANSNTVGFKSGDVTFGDVMNNSVASGLQIGLGVTVEDVNTDFSQGVFETSTNGLDMAIDGEGFFIVQDGAGTTNYTRSGEFHLDKNGNLITAQGNNVQGYAISSTATSSTLADVSLNFSAIAPQTTSTASITANLNSSSSIQTFALATPSATSAFNTSITVYDSLGNNHLITLYFTKTASNTWVVNGVVPAADATSAADTIAYTQVLTFTTSGALDTEPATTVNDFDFSGGPAQTQTIAFNFGDSITTDSGTGLLGTTQYGTTSAVTSQSQNGYSSGSLQRISIDSTGIVTGIFSNGSTSNVAQIAIATFPNTNGLGLAGKSLYIETNDSGQPLTGTAGSSGRGKIKSSALELSNVDLAAEFVKMITFQRGFQANSRVITMSDEVMNELVNIKR